MAEPEPERDEPEHDAGADHEGGHGHGVPKPSVGGLVHGLENSGPKKKRDRQLAYIAVAVGVVGALIAWMSYRKQAAAQAAGATLPNYRMPGTGQVAGAGQSGGVIPGGAGVDAGQGSFNTSMLEALTGLGQQLQGISGQLSNLSPASNPTGGSASGDQNRAPAPQPSPQPAPGTYVSPGGTPSGSGWLPPAGIPFAAASAQSPSGAGGLFEWLTNMTQEQQYAAAGGPVFFESGPGLFNYVPPQNMYALKAGTPLYGLPGQYGLPGTGAYHPAP